MGGGGGGIKCPVSVCAVKPLNAERFLFQFVSKNWGLKTKMSVSVGQCLSVSNSIQLDSNVICMVS